MTVNLFPISSPLHEVELHRPGVKMIFAADRGKVLDLCIDSNLCLR
jgi:hypothetical protein